MTFSSAFANFISNYTLPIAIFCIIGYAWLNWDKIKERIKKQKNKEENHLPN